MLLKNLNYLVTSHYGTQTAFGDFIDRSQSIVSRYLTGKAPIPESILKKIAADCGVSVSALKYDDLSENDISFKEDEKTYTLEELSEFLLAMLPIINYQESMNSEAFQKGLQLYCSSFSGPNLDQKKIRQALFAFEESWKQSNLYPALANYIMIVFIIASRQNFPVSANIQKHLFTKGKLSEIDIKKINSLRAKRTEKEKYIARENRAKLVEEFYEKIMQYLLLLKGCEEYRDLVEYLIACKYLVGFVDKDIEWESDPTAVLTMFFDHIYTLYYLQNQYAIDLYNRSIEKL